MSHLSPKKKQLTWSSADFFLARNDVKFLAHKRITLLDKVAEHGSIAAAARDIGMSYKAAWDAINTMNNLADQPLFLRQAGGKQGGRTELTEYGHDIINYFKRAHAAHHDFLLNLNQKLGMSGVAHRVLRRMAMNTSCRNQLIGKVSAIQSARLSCEVQLVTMGGSEITAQISQKSLESLGIVVGSEVHALIKSSSILLSNPQPGMLLSTRNQLTGEVTRVVTGLVNAEVTVMLNAQEHMVATVTNDAVQDLALQKGCEVLLCFKVSSVILGVMR